MKVIYSHLTKCFSHFTVTRITVLSLNLFLGICFFQKNVLLKKKKYKNAENHVMSICYRQRRLWPSLQGSLGITE